MLNSFSFACAGDEGDGEVAEYNWIQSYFNTMDYNIRVLQRHVSLPSWNPLGLPTIDSDLVVAFLFSVLLVLCFPEVVRFLLLLAGAAYACRLHGTLYDLMIKYPHEVTGALVAVVVVPKCVSIVKFCCLAVELGWDVLSGITTPRYVRFTFSSDSSVQFAGWHISLQSV